MENTVIGTNAVPMNAPNITLPSSEQYITSAMSCALELWNKIQHNPNIRKLSDDEKIKFFTTEPKHNVFYMRFPIVGRYMICLNQFKPKAFKRFLQKQIAIIFTPSVVSIEASSKDAPSTDKMLQLQAKYVQYLWEETQRDMGAHLSAGSGGKIYEEAYKMLKDEDTDFKKRYDTIEKELARAKTSGDVARAKELLDRLANNEQTIPEEQLNVLHKILSEQLKKQNSS